MGQYIRQLSALDTLSSGDNMAIGSTSNGDDRRAPLSVLLTWLESNLSISDAAAFVEYTTQYAAPAATGQTIQVTDGDDNIHLILTPVAAYAAMTITLPSSTNLVDKQDLLINSTQAVTTLTINGNGATVVGAPASIVANAFFRLKYDLAGNTWYLIGAGDALASYTVSAADDASTLVLRDGSADIVANAFESTVVTGTAPLTIASTTVVANLNADQTDGYDADETDTGSTLAARDASGDIQANAFESTVVTGTAPLTVASTTVVSNFNSDTVDGFDAQIASGASTIVVQDTDSYSQIGKIIIDQAACIEKTTSTTLTAAEIANGLISVNNGAGATTSLQLPTGSDMDTEFDTMGFDQAFDFSVYNSSTVAAEDADITTNTGWTLRGNMDIEADDSSNARSSGRFRARRVAASTWRLYRIA